MIYDKHAAIGFTFDFSFNETSSSKLNIDPADKNFEAVLIFPLDGSFPTIQVVSTPGTSETNLYQALN